MRDKKFVFILFLIVLIIAVLLYYLFNMKQTEEVIINTDEETTSKETKSVDYSLDYDTFFKLNTLVNKYYNAVSLMDKYVLFDILNSDYIASEMISNDNLETLINPNNQIYTFYLKDFSAKQKGNVQYFFLLGKLESYDSNSKETILKDQLLILKNDKTSNTYSIIPKVSYENLDDLGNSYTLLDSNITVNENNVFVANLLSSEEKVKYYIDYYKKLLNLDMQDAYAYLSDAMLNTYDTYEKFTDDIDNINAILSSKMSSYKFNKNGVIQANLEGNKTITFKENKIMDFKVTIK